MSNRSRRVKTNIDYKLLHETGQISQKDTSTETENICEQEIDEISYLFQNISVTDCTEMADDKINEISVLIDDINDFMEENEIDTHTTVISDIDICVDKIEAKRSSLRAISNQLRTVIGEIKWESDFGKNIEITFANIKTYIISAKNQRKSIRIHEESHIFRKEASDEKYQLVIRNQKIESAEFAVNEIFRLVNELSKDMKISDKMSNDQILQKESSLQNKLSQCEKLSKKKSILIGNHPT